jgi:DNA-binding beta-propeller fold protein YncE
MGIDRKPFHVVLFLAAAAFSSVQAQDNPYREDGWAKFPDGRRWGWSSAIDIDKRGNIWVFERCGANSCAASKVAPLVQLTPKGKVLRTFGAGMFAWPHGIYIDRAGAIWVADGDGKDGKGHQVVKFSPEGKVLMRLGKAGVAGDGPDTFNRPSDVVTAPNGDIFVADGHGGDSNARIVKFSKDGKFIKTWGKKGTATGEFNTPHALALDSKGRLFVGDRGNSRIQIFDQEGNFLEEWRQFGRPSGIYIDKSDRIYVADHQSDKKLNPGFKRGIRIGSAKDGKVAALIPGLGADPETQSVGEGVVADAKGNVWWAETSGMNVRKFVLK